MQVFTEQQPIITPTTGEIGIKQEAIGQLSKQEFHPVEMAWRAYSTLNEWIRFADTKAGLVLAANGVIGSIGAAAYPLAKTYLITSTFAMGVLILACIGGIISTYFAACCLNPTISFGPGALRRVFRRRNSRKDNTSPTEVVITHEKSLIFFDHIVDNFKDPEAYTQAAKVVFSSNDDAFRQVSHQMYWNSRVAKEKFNAVGKATFWLSVTLGSCLLACIFSMVPAWFHK